MTGNGKAIPGKWVDRYRAGECVCEGIASALGISVSQVSILLRRQGVVMSHCGPKPFVIPPALIADLKAGRQSPQQVAAQLRISRWTVYGRLRKLGVSPASLSRERTRQSGLVRRHLMNRLYEDGKTEQEIGRQFGVTRQRVSQILNGKGR